MRWLLLSFLTMMIADSVRFLSHSRKIAQVSASELQTNYPNTNTELPRDGVSHRKTRTTGVCITARAAFTRDASRAASLRNATDAASWIATLRLLICAASPRMTLPRDLSVTRHRLNKITQISPMSSLRLQIGQKQLCASQCRSEYTEAAWE